jgi:hypothetical protein
MESKTESRDGFIAKYEFNGTYYYASYHNMGWSQRLDGKYGWNEWVEFSPDIDMRKSFLSHYDKDNFEEAINDRNIQATNGHTMDFDKIKFIEATFKRITSIEIKENETKKEV